MNGAVLAGVVWSGVMVQAVAPLTDAQRAQLDTAGDYSSVLDEGALYPLLKDAAGWREGDEAGATVPDYAAIREQPAKHRGTLFLIEGAFQRAISAGKYARPGPWDGRAQQWVVKWGDNFEDVAVIELVTPPPPPKYGQRVRLVARFYKVWNEKDQTGKEASFLTFVGNTAAVTSGGSAGVSDRGGEPTWWVAGGLVAAVGLGWFMMKRLKRMGSNAPIRPSEALRHRRQQRGDDFETHEPPNDEAPDLLPHDPADALAELSRRHQPRGDP